MMELFRKITKEEFDGLRRLFPDGEELWQKYRTKRQGEFDRKEIDVYAVEANHTFIGEVTVHYTSSDLPIEAIPGQRVYFQAFRMDEAHRGRGLGQRLLRFALTDLERRGYTQFTIGVEEDNKVAKHIYFKLGFTRAIDKGCGDELDPSDYTLYMRSI